LEFHQSFWLTGLSVEIQLSRDFDVASNVQNTEVVFRGNLSKSGLTCKETLDASVFQLSKSNPFYWIFIDFNLSEITMPYFLGIRMG
jgi:hypothetical protein